MLDKELIVSVKMITYNHQDYIKEAIEGVLMQETDFEFDLIIADDCSPDDTKEIVSDLIINHSKGFRIKYFRHEKNLGMHANGLFGLNECKGKYIALCEGDDYWTDPLKLQKQVDFLEINRKYSLCFHNAIVMDQNNGDQHLFNKSVKKKYTIRDVIIRRWFCPTASVVVRNEIFKNSILTSRNKKIINGDMQILFNAALYGPLHGIDEVMSVYRSNVPGSVSDNNKRIDLKYKNYLKFLFYINKKTNNKFIFYIILKVLKIMVSFVKKKVINFSIANNE